MDGYSVTEAASVLGVPTERVWELLARGVLAGAPEGETGMRVFLQPRPSSAPPEPKGPNGGEREPDRELSPFRELLTEFRNLTERYGQALLALGESRGEVASLRSRVDLLEARMDLRLPSSSSVAAGWPTASPFPAEHTVIPTAPPEPGPMVAPMPDPEASAAGAASEVAPGGEGEVTAVADEEHRAHRARGPRRATESFAEALARADDPSIPELPRADAAPAMAELRAGQMEPDESALPRELPAAEAVPVAEEPPAASAEPEASQASEIAGEPWMAEHGPDAAQPQIREEFTAEVEAEPAGAVAGRVTGLLGAPEMAIETPAEETARELREAASEAPTDQPQPTPSSEVAIEEPPLMEEPPPLEWDAERYTTAIDEPDWLEAEALDAPPAAEESQPMDDGISESHSEPPSNAASTTDLEAGASVGADAEVSMDGGSDASDQADSEVSADAAAPASVEATGGKAEAESFPGSADLDRALSELRRGLSSADRGGADETRTTSQASEPTPPRPMTSSEPLSPRPPSPSRPMPPVITPAGRAYRRLRRIFPG